ncbi:hypothetical protein DTO212C5_7420 [Paecilomyces variotii]|nr:hypothetical protein DTO212C5_7420 [Paecilomyces variotii]
MYRRPDNTLTVTLTPSSLQKQRKLVAFIIYSREFDPRRDHGLLFLFLHIPSSLYLDTGTGYSGKSRIIVLSRFNADKPPNLGTFLFLS